MFNIIQSSNELNDIMTTIISIIVSKIAETNNSVSELQNVDMKLDKKITTVNGKQISPTVKLPTIEPLENPLDGVNIQPTNINPEIKSGDLIYNLMNSIDTTILNVINGIIDNIKTCSKKLMSPSDMIKKIKDWFKDINNKIWTAIKTKYKEWSNNIFEYKKNKNKTLEELWTRALKWLKKKIKEISDILLKIKGFIVSICTYLSTIPSLLKDKLSTFMSDMGEVSSDINELTIQSTEAFA